MVKQYDIFTILKLLVLLSTTNSGLKKEEFDHLRKTFIMCYGYQEITTLINLQDSKLFRVRDKRMDWTKIKNVSLVLPIIKLLKSYCGIDELIGVQTY